MYSTANKKMLNMLILEILENYSDENHRLSQQDIIRLLKSNYDMECDRRSVKNNILYLIELGYDISMEKGYYLVEREFEDAELRMLIDSVLFSNQLTHKQAKTLIDKLTKQSNVYFNAKVSHISSLPNLSHSDNKQLLYVIDTLNDAISQKKKVSFIYNDYGTDFKLHPRREEPYIVNPYQMVANLGKFYLVGNYDKYDDISHYRLDRMTGVIILDEKAKSQKDIKEISNGLNLPKHMAEHIYMYNGESIRVKFIANKDAMNDLIDWFCRDFTVLEENGDKITVSLRCNEKSFIFWALQFGPYTEVLEPKKLRNKLTELIKGMYETYTM